MSSIGTVRRALFGMFWIFLAVMIVMFMGTPDLHDAIIFNLSAGDLDSLNSLAVQLD